MNNSRLRVLMVMDSLSVGGTETYVLSLVKAFPAIGIQPIYAGATGAMYDAFVRAGCPIHQVHLTAEQLLSVSRQEQAEQALMRIMRHRQVDIVHVHQTPSGLFAAQAASKLGIPVVFTVHGAYYPPEQLQAMRALGSQFISVSPPVKAYLDRQGIASELISNGIDFDQFKPLPQHELRAKFHIPDEAKVVVYASRLAWDKAAVCAMLIRAARTIRQSGPVPLHAVIAGSGNQYAAIAELADTVNREYGTTFIHLAGSQMNMRDYYNLGDLVVGTGRVALEAMACSKPVLAVGNHGYFGVVEEHVYDEAWRYYFGDHDSKERPSEQLLTTALRELLSSQELLVQIGSQGRKWALSQFNIQDKALQMKAFYSSLG